MEAQSEAAVTEENLLKQLQLSRYCRSDFHDNNINYFECNRTNKPKKSVLKNYLLSSLFYNILIYPSLEFTCTNNIYMNLI